MKNVTIKPGCITCGTCQAICPEVFVIEKTAQIKPNADIQKYEKLILEAADICPMQVIAIQHDENKAN